IRGIDRATLANTRKYLQIVERNKCQAPEMTLRVGCLLEAAAQNCKQLARELHRRYAGLVAELAMSEFFPGPRADTAALATGIDGFCTDVAGTRDLSWQYCVAAVVWFVASDGATEEPR